MFYFLLTLNVVFYKRNKKIQFNFHQFLKYTIYNFKNLKLLKFQNIYIYIYIYIYIILKKIKNNWMGHGPSPL